MANIGYSSIIKRSWHLTWKNKWLWVYGLILTIFGGSGGGGGGNFPNFSGSTPKEDLPEKTSQVLGAATNWLSQVPVSTWVFLGIGIFLLVIVGVAVSLIIQNWAKGALIAGLQDADNAKPVTLATTSPRGLIAFKHLIILGLITIGIVLAVLLATSLLVAVGYFLLSFSKVIQTVWLGVVGATAVIAFIIFAILTAMVTIYAERLIVLQNFSPWAAWKKGFSLGHHNFLPTAVMGIINMAIGCSVGCTGALASLLILGIPTLILLLPVINNGSQAFTAPIIIGLIILFLLFIHVQLLVRAALTVFNFSNWNLLFKQLYD